MAAIASLPHWTVARYLEMERDSEVRHECIDGAVYALAGGTRAHSVIAINLAAGLHAAVRGGPCRVYSSDMKVRVTPTRYVYPDLSVGCEALDTSSLQRTVYDVLVNTSTDIMKVVMKTAFGFDLAPSNIDLAGVEVELKHQPLDLVL